MNKLTLICIDNTGYPYLTIGNKYDAVLKNNKIDHVIDYVSVDSGYLIKFSSREIKKLFITLAEHRERQIDKILNG